MDHSLLMSMVNGVSQNMHMGLVEHINKLEPFIIKEMRGSRFRGSITNMAKSPPNKRELCILIDTSIKIGERYLPVRL